MHGPVKLLRVGLILLTIPLFLLAYLLVNIIKYLAPNFSFKIGMKMLSNLELQSWFNIDQIRGAEDIQFLFSPDIMKYFVESSIQDILKPANLGSDAPNPQMIELSSKSVTSLLSMAKAGRPLVLNFGSCT
eukprot:GFUD01123678.1.p1 GENE.GFUD01123678.1~~GFUD01123678.1.p1  ORF type:complete len:144 (+),score=31.10 GFUD01123678.1:42-434(+)